MAEPWRERLRAAVNRTNLKHAFIAAEAGIDPATLSRILNGREHPRFETVVRIAHVCREPVGWLLGEKGFELSNEQRRMLHRAVDVIVHLTQGGAVK